MATLRGLVAFVLTSGMLASGGFAVAQVMIVEFNDNASLLAMPRPFTRAPAQFANFYKEDGMLFTSNISPPDPAVPNESDIYHYHLGHEDSAIGECFLGQEFGRQTLAGCERVDHANEPRRLASHQPGHVIQMVYDPNNDGVPDPFNLISLDVHYGRLNVGVKSPSGIAVYNNLTSGNRWLLLNANNLTRATLETPFDADTAFIVDAIFFEPAGSLTTTTSTTTTATRSRASTASLISGDTVRLPPEDVRPNSHAAIGRELLALIPLRTTALKVGEMRVTRLGPSRDRLTLSGRIRLEAARRGVAELLKEGVSVSVGEFPLGYRAMISARLFSCTGDDRTGTECVFEGESGGVTSMRLAIAENKVRFRLKAEGLNLGGIRLDKRVSISVQIGSDLAVASIKGANDDSDEGPNDESDEGPDDD